MIVHVLQCNKAGKKVHHSFRPSFNVRRQLMNFADTSKSKVMKFGSEMKQKCHVDRYLLEASTTVRRGNDSQSRCVESLIAKRYLYSSWCWEIWRTSLLVGHVALWPCLLSLVRMKRIGASPGRASTVATSRPHWHRLDESKRCRFQSVQYQSDALRRSTGRSQRLGRNVIRRQRFALIRHGMLFHFHRLQFKGWNWL